METIKSKFDKDTVYKVTDKAVTISKDGEDMKIPIRQIPKMAGTFIPEIKAELLDIYEKNLPEEKPTEIPCAICGKLFPKQGRKRVCSHECRKKSLVRQNAERRKKAAEEKRKNGVEKVCKYCGKKFVLHDSFNQEYCTVKCRDAIKNADRKSTFETKREKKKKISQCGEIERNARKIGLRYADIQKQETLAMVGSIKIY